MKNKLITFVIVLTMLFFSLSPLISTVHYNANPDSQQNKIVRPDNVPSTGNIVLWNTEGFTGNWGSNDQVFWGTAYYYYVGYPGGESNPNYNWYVIATQFFKGSGKDAVDIGGTHTTMCLWSSNHVWNVNANPISKSPTSTGKGEVGLSTGYVSVNVGYNGYDTGTISGGNPAAYGEFNWLHKFTIADQNTWGSMSGAYSGKVSATNAHAWAEGTVSIQYYMWWTGGWNPFAGVSNWAYATYDSGASGYATYPNSVASS